MKKNTWKTFSKDLNWLTICNEGFEKEIKYFGISKLGLELSEEVERKSINIAVMFGKTEMDYLSQFSDEIVYRKLDKIFKAKPPLVILSKSFDYEIVQNHAIENNVTVFKSSESSSNSNLLYSYHALLMSSDEVLIHGNLIEIFGVGILIVGESGLGKSEISLELIKNGHQFIADDAVLYKRVFNYIHGRSDEKTKGFMEIRGLGIINLSKIFGVNSLKDSCNIDIIVELELYDSSRSYERLGEEIKYKNLLDIKVPYFRIPVSPGRKVSEIIEVIAGIQKLRSQNYSPLDDFRKMFDGE